MQDTSDRSEAASAPDEVPGAEDVSRRALLEKIERYAYAAPALALLVAPTAAAAGYGKGGGKGGGKSKGGKGGGKGGKGGGKGGGRR